MTTALREPLHARDRRHARSPTRSSSSTRARQFRNPVIFIVEVGSVIVSAIFVIDAVRGDTGQEPLWFTGAIAFWLWLTVLFANFAEAMAEGRGKAQANALRATRTTTVAHRRLPSGGVEDVPAPELRPGDVVVVTAGEVIPADGEIVEGVGSVDESAITGESAPVIREAGGDRSGVTGGTRLLSDQPRDRGHAGAGALVPRPHDRPRRGRRAPQDARTRSRSTSSSPASRSPSSRATVTLYPYALYAGTDISMPVLIALLVALIPTTIGGLLSAIGIAGMDRLVRRNVLAMSGRAVEAAGDVDVLLLDKTGHDHARQPAGERARSRPTASTSASSPTCPARLAGRRDARGAVDRRPREGATESASARSPRSRPTFIPFTATTRMSGVDLERHADPQGRAGRGQGVRRGRTADAFPRSSTTRSSASPRTGGTPLLVARDNWALGAVHLKDIVKGGMEERFVELRRMGIRSIMITGDNPVTAAVIASESGVDDFLAEATPERKMELIKDEQAKGRLVAMTGDGTNDAPRSPSRTSAWP